MIKQQDDGSWLASCPICSWKNKFSTEYEANNELNNHTNVEHKEGKKPVKDKSIPVPPKKLPPQIPAPIKENY